MNSLLVIVEYIPHPTPPIPYHFLKFLSSSPVSELQGQLVYISTLDGLETGEYLKNVRRCVAGIYRGSSKESNGKIESAVNLKQLIKQLFYNL